MHNNGRPVTFQHVRMRNTETWCIFCWLAHNWRPLTTWTGENGKREENIFANCIQRTGGSRNPWNGRRVVQKQSVRRRTQSPLRLYQALWSDLNISNGAASKWRLPAKCFLSVLPSLPPSLEQPEPEPRLEAFDDQTRDTISAAPRCSTPSSKERAAAKAESPSLIGREI